MSFFEEGDEPRRAPSPRRPLRARGPGADHQTLLARRVVAGVVGLLFIALLIFAVNGCLNSAKKTALKDYNRNVTQLATQSQAQGKQLLDLLTGGAEPLQLQDQVNSLRGDADDLVRQAKKVDTPGEMKAPQRYLLQSFQFRRNGIAKIAAQLPAAFGQEGADAALKKIAGQMQFFVASDVIYQADVAPLIQQVLDDKEIGGQTVVKSAFLSDLGWLDPAYVGRQIGAQGGSSPSTSGTPAPGLHGTGLASVSVGAVALGSQANTIPLAGGPPSFDVKFTNQGENDETNVKVKVTVTLASGGGTPVTGQAVVPAIARGETKTASVKLKSVPPRGRAVNIRVEVAAVPGEKKTDNNSQTFRGLFR